MTQNRPSKRRSTFGKDLTSMTIKSDLEKKTLEVVEWETNTSTYDLNILFVLLMLISTSVHEINISDIYTYHFSSWWVLHLHMFHFTEIKHTYMLYIYTRLTAINLHSCETKWTNTTKRLNLKFIWVTNLKEYKHFSYSQTRPIVIYPL